MEECGKPAREWSNPATPNPLSGYPERAGTRGRGRDSRASGGALAVARLSPLRRWRRRGARLSPLRRWRRSSLRRWRRSSLRGPQRSSLRGAAPSLRQRGFECGPPAVAVPCPPPWRRSFNYHVRPCYCHLSLKLEME
jgi:hypothetical protein